MGPSFRRGPLALGRRIRMGRAAGAREVNVGWTNRSECNEQWYAAARVYRAVHSY
jgi:hypothetical protein